MSFLSIAQEIKESGFDPRKDSANGPAKIPAGSYSAILKKAEFGIAESGWESILYEFEIRGGEFNGRKELAGFGTLPTWNGKDLKWSVERMLKFFQKALTLADDAPMKKDFEDGVSLAEALQRKAVGSYYTLVIAETKGKNGNVYRNYDLEEDQAAAENPLGAKGPMEIDDDDLPF